MAKDNLKELEADISDFFNERLNIKNIPIDLKFLFISDIKQKQLITLVKIPDVYSVSLKKDILVRINPTYFDAFDEKGDDINKILFDNAIDKIETNLEKGTFKITNPNFKANIDFIEQYSYKKVQRALETEQLFEQQLKEKETEKKNNNETWTKKQ